MNARSRQQSSDEQELDNGQGGSKRKRLQASSSQTRAKRNRYTSIACNECKRRKIKCNGDTPCMRCGNLSLECLYAANCCSNGGFRDSEEFQQMNAHIQHLQEQVDSLWANLNALNQNSNENVISPSLNKSTPFPGNAPSMFGDLPPATRELYAQEVAKALGREFVFLDPSLEAQGPMLQPQTEKDPLWSVSKEEILRLCGVYEDEIGSMYPMLNMKAITIKAGCLGSMMESVMRTGLLGPEISRGDAFRNEDTNLLKMVLAVALTVEGNGSSDLGKRFCSSVRRAYGEKLWAPDSLEGLRLLVIMAQYLFHLDGEGQAYRIIGVAARTCFEMGLHSRERLLEMFKTDDEVLWAVRLFWTIYVLDRRWSFDTNMPFAIQDADVDLSMPEPDAGTPYLVAMVAYGRLSSKVCRSFNFDTVNNEVKQEEILGLDCQLRQWQNSIPDLLQFHPYDNKAENGLDRGLRRLRVVLALRANQLRILIYRPVLHSITTIMDNIDHTHTVIEVAKDTVRILTQLNHTSDIYRSQQICFNHFLVSALSVLFLAVFHHPLEFSTQVRGEVYLALDLVKGLSTNSYVSKRLWQTIRGLKEIGSRLGLVPVQPQPKARDPHSSAAVAMAGLAGHQVDEVAAFPPPNGNELLSPGASPMDGEQMSCELTTLFEAVGGYGVSNGMPSDGMTGFVDSRREHYGEGVSGLYGNEEEFSRIMKDCF